MHQYILGRSYLTTFLSLRVFRRKILTLLTAAVNVTLNFKFLNLFTRYILKEDLPLTPKVAIS